MGAFDSRGPQGLRGLKRCLPLVVYLLGLGRGPQGPRGLKLPADDLQRIEAGSRSARTARIETVTYIGTTEEYDVAVRKDRED